MTREQFTAKALRAAERAIRVPPGWWGTWRDVYSPSGTVRIRFSNHGRCWVIRHNGIVVSRHDSRSFAIAKARKL